MRFLFFAAAILLSFSAQANPREQGFVWGDFSYAWVDQANVKDFKELKGKCILFVETPFPWGTNKDGKKEYTNKGVQTWGFVTSSQSCASDKTRLSKLSKVIIPKSSYTRLSAADEAAIDAYRRIDPNAYYVNVNAATDLKEEKDAFNARVAGVSSLFTMRGVEGRNCIAYLEIPGAPVTKYGVWMHDSRCENFQNKKNVSIKVSGLQLIMDKNRLLDLERQSASGVSAKDYFFLRWSGSDEFIVR